MNDKRVIEDWLKLYNTGIVRPLMDPATLSDRLTISRTSREALDEIDGYLRPVYRCQSNSRSVCQRQDQSTGRAVLRAQTRLGFCVLRRSRRRAGCRRRILPRFAADQFR